jgi:hypothetical protein
MTTIAIFQGRNPYEVRVGLDTCAEVSVISTELAEEWGLVRQEDDTPPIRWIHKREEAVSHYIVPLQITDCRGEVRRVEVQCVGVDRPKDQGLPILLGQPMLIAERIVLFPAENRWWFEVGPTKVRIDNAKRFRKISRNAAYVYAIMAVPADQFYLPGIDDDDESVPNRERFAAVATQLPSELHDSTDVFDTSKTSVLPPSREADHAIDLLPDTHPPWGPIYPLSPAELEELRRFIAENLANGRIRPSKSPAGAPILFVPKKDGTLRLCVDYRGLNKVTEKNRYALPLITEILDRVAGASWFSKIDVKDAYYRIRIKPGDEWKTAFRTRYGHFEFLVMPMGLTNAPATFQSYIHQALRGLVDNSCIVYLDDILIYSKTREEHTRHVREVLERLREAQLYAQVSKCQFYQEEISFLGFVLNRQGIAMDTARVQTIREWPEPTSYHDIQVFLGFCNFYRRFIYQYSGIVAPLTNLLKGMVNGRKPGLVRLEAESLAAFHRLRNEFQKAPLLRHFDPARPIRLDTDASEFAAAGILSQKGDDGLWRPVAFWSRKFKGPEERYGTPDKEMLAIVESFRHWRHYLEGSRDRVEVYSDHKNLEGFMRQPRLNGRQARWCMYLAGYDFVIYHQEGKRNAADAPSRRPDYEDKTRPKRLEFLPALAARMAKMDPPDLSDLAEEAALAESNGVGAPKGSGTNDGEPTWPRQPTDSGPTSPGVGVRDALLRDARPEGDRPPLERAKTQHAYGQNGPLSTTLDAYYLEVDGQQEPHVQELSPIGSRGSLGAVEGWYRGTVGRERLVPRQEAREALVNEVTVSPAVSEPFQALVLKAQKNDSRTQELLGKAQERAAHRRIASASTPRLWTVDENGGLRHRGRLWVPEAEQGIKNEILQAYHDDPSAGHFGVNKTQELIARKFYWEHMRSEVQEYISKCQICLGTVPKRHRPYGELQSLPLPDGPMQEISVDFITGLPETLHELRPVDAILVIVDRFTKYSYFLPTNRTLNAAELVQILHREFELIYGPPKGIVSDRGSLFTSSFWSELTYQSRIKRRVSTAFHPQTDGQTERLNQTLEQYLRAFTGQYQMDWPNLLRIAQFAYNKAEQATIRMSPAMALFGYNPDFMTRFDSETTANRVPAVADRLQKLEAVRAKLEENWARAVESQKKYYDQRHKPQVFRRNDLIGLSTKNLKLKGCRKLNPLFIGPFRVLNAVGKGAYRIALPEKYDRIHNVFPMSLLEPWQQRDTAESMPLPDLDEDPEEYEVEELRDKATIQSEVHYLVKWKGWPSEYNRWVPLSDMENCMDMVRKFDKTRKRKGGATVPTP